MFAFDSRDARPEPDLPRRCLECEATIIRGTFCETCREPEEVNR